MTSEFKEILIFKSLSDALRAGFQIYDRTQDGYMVRVRTQLGWGVAKVCLEPTS